MGAVILLWIQFGFSFILKGRKDVASSEAQSRYYKGLGAFVISVAVSESTYLLDLFARDITGQRIFTKYNTPETFYSFIEVDYYVLSFILVLVGLTFLMYPMEEYLYAKKRKTFTIAIAFCIPAPIIFRIVEINHRSLGMDLSNNSTMDYQLMAAAWILVIIIAGMGLLYLLKLYMDLGRKAPRGSKLRKKSRQIILGLLLWLAAIFSTSGLLKSISSVTSDWGPYSTINVGFTGWFVRNQLYYVMPFIIPILLFSALRLLIVGFTREYA